MLDKTKQARQRASTVAWDRFRRSEICVLFLTSLWTAVVLQVYLPVVLLLPMALVPGVGISWFRLVSGAYETHWGRHSCLAIPISWCHTTFRINDFEYLMKFKAKGNALLLSSHCSRVDWLLTTYMGMVGDTQARVGFVFEATAAFMPIVGWSRALLGDILLQRAFLKDRPQITSNIESFHDSGATRLLLLAPEGTIADPGLDDDYVKNCSDFMLREGKQPMTHLLTPRYKGMTVLVAHSPENVASTAMSFVRGSKINSKTGAVEGGVLYSTSLAGNRRVIPDLHSIFEGGLQVFIMIHELKIECYQKDAQPNEKTAKKIRAQLIEDQEIKDGWMRGFEKNRKFDCIGQGSDWKAFPRLHLRMNGTLLAHTWLTCVFVAWLTGCSRVAVIKAMGWVVLGVFVLHGSTHKIGRWSSDGVSRESLVGETAVKAFLSAFYNRSMNQGGKEDAAKKNK